jgi:hypothetical protein
VKEGIVHPNRRDRNDIDPPVARHLEITTPASGTPLREQEVQDGVGEGVRETDVLLVNGGDPLYLCHWMRQSGPTDLLASLPETVWVGLSAGSLVMTPRIGEDVHWPPPTGGDETLGVQRGGDVGVHASISIAQALLAADVVDELRLAIGPMIVGRGRRFLDRLPSIQLELIRSEISPTGYLLVDYRVTRSVELQDG